MLDWVQNIRRWWIGQRAKLRHLRQACLPLTLIALGIATVGIAVLALVPLPGLLGILIGSAVALLPLFIVFCWLIRIPDIWDIHAGWVAAATFLTSLPLFVFGQYFAAVTLTAIFREAPILFPIAQTVAGYIGVVLVALTVVTFAALMTMILSVNWTLFAGIMGWMGGKRFLRDLSVYGAAALLIGWGLASALHLEWLARDLVTRVAVEADFHETHRCETAGWPSGVTRVAFIGDEQVLGYLPKEKQIVVLSCRRTHVMGGQH